MDGYPRPTPEPSDNGKEENENEMKAYKFQLETRKSQNVLLFLIKILRPYRANDDGNRKQFSEKVEPIRLEK